MSQTSEIAKVGEEKTSLEIKSYINTNPKLYADIVNGFKNTIIAIYFFTLISVTPAK